jgi:hypothetical protein
VQLRVVVALLCAFAGVVIATLLGVDTMAATGEGGRLGYTPVAWLAFALGVAGGRPAAGDIAARHRPTYADLGLALLVCATVVGAAVLRCATL